MARITKKADELWQKGFAKRLRQLIHQKGYVSAYDFWVQECGEEISRANLDNILNGRVDPKISTIRKLARGLKISLAELLEGVE